MMAQQFTRYLTIREELQNALDSQTSDGREAFTLTETIFSRVRVLLHGLCPDMSFIEIDLRLADLQRDVREELLDHLYGAIDRDIAVDIIASHFFGEHA
jgi:hypothetical protein